MEPAARLSVLSYVLAYLMWLVCIAACIVALLQFQSAANLVGAALGMNRYALRLGNQVILLVGGVIAFTYAMLLEGYYRHGVRRRVLLRRFLRTIAVPLILIVLSLVLVQAALTTVR